MSTIKFDDLKDDCIQHILDFVPIRDLFGLQSVSKKFNELIDSRFRRQKVLMVSRSKNHPHEVNDNCICDDPSHKPSPAATIYIKKLDQLPWILSRFGNLKALYLFLDGISITSPWKNYGCTRDNLRNNRSSQFAKSCPRLEHLHIAHIVSYDVVFVITKELCLRHVGLQNIDQLSVMQIPSKSRHQFMLNLMNLYRNTIARIVSYN